MAKAGTVTHRPVRDRQLQTHPWASMLQGVSFADRAPGRDQSPSTELPNPPVRILAEETLRGGVAKLTGPISNQLNLATRCER